LETPPVGRGTRQGRNMVGEARQQFMMLHQPPA
jgi:hypothetical protein